MSLLNDFNDGDDFDTDNSGFNSFSIQEEDDFYAEDEEQDIISDTTSSSDDTGTDKSEEEKKGLKKTGLWFIGIAAIVLIFIAIMLNIIAHAKQSSKNKVRVVQTVEQTEAPTQQSVQTQGNTVMDLGGKKGSEAATKAEEQATTANTNTQGDWVEVGLSSSNVNFGAPIEGIFTVTGINTYARLTGVSNDKQIKAIVTGSISGLAGTYTVELPADKALKLEIGNSFKIDYQLKEVNGYKLVGEIRY